MTEHSKAYATDLLAPGIQDLPPPPGEFHKPQFLRRRTASRIDASAHLNQEQLSDQFRGHASVLKSFSHGAADFGNGHRELGNSARLGLFDPLSPTPIVADSNNVSDTRPPTLIGFSEPLGYSQELHGSSEASRSASNDSYYSTVSAGSATTVVPLGACISRIGTKLGPMNDFTQQWPKPPPLTAPDIENFLDDLELTETNLRKSIGAVSLESGTEDSGGVLKLQWFDRWANFKWNLLFSVFSVFIYGTAGLVCAIMIWFQVWQKADVMFIADHDIVVFITLASLILIFAALTGLTGTLLSSRPILAFYTLLLWSSLITMCAIGYTTYRRATFALEQRLDVSWVRYYTPLSRLMIQNTLQCCGWSSSSHEGIPSEACFPRASLSGCKGPLLTFEQANLQRIWATIFSLVPMHLMNTFVVMLYASHVTRTTGTGVAPKRRCLGLKGAKQLMYRERAGIGGVKRPGIVRAGSLGFRDGREETEGLLKAYLDEVKEQ